MGGGLQEGYVRPDPGNCVARGEDLTDAAEDNLELVREVEADRKQRPPKEEHINLVLTGEGVLLAAAVDNVRELVPVDGGYGS